MSKKTSVRKEQLSSPYCYSYIFVMVLNIFTLVNLLTSNLQPTETKENRNSKIIMQVLWTIAYHYLFSYLCSRQYYTTGWIIALLPIFMAMLITSYMLGIFVGLKNCKNEDLLKQLQI